jgi:hypothetical protein
MVLQPAPGLHVDVHQAVEVTPEKTMSDPVDLVAAAVSLVSTIVFFAANRAPRATVDTAVAPLKVPERRMTYSAGDIMEFRQRALNAPGAALDLYCNRVLLIDIGFAISLALTSAILWQFSESLGAPHWLAMVGTVMSCLYGICDVGEDLALRILLQRDSVTVSGASRAAAFTLGKLLTICLSIFGVVIFLALSTLLGPPKRRP